MNAPAHRNLTPACNNRRTCCAAVRACLVLPLGRPHEIHYEDTHFILDDGQERTAEQRAGPKSGQLPSQAFFFSCARSGQFRWVLLVKRLFFANDIRRRTSRHWSTPMGLTTALAVCTL